MKTKDAKRLARELAREKDYFDDTALAAIQEALERAFPRTRWGRHLSEAILQEISERTRGAENLQKWLPSAMPVPATLHEVTRTLRDTYPPTDRPLFYTNNPLMKGAK